MPITSMASPGRWTARPDTSAVCCRQGCTAVVEGAWCPPHLAELRDASDAAVPETTAEPAVLRWLDRLDQIADQIARTR